ncbi:hypothetical protein PR003_g8163 [Phytophthora rubi]|uniref:Uncharacterized protein n=1 Tax=Phytophthora rubi TaxID=129364 RepID=A0A6A3NAA1_9STRA|nr:hypothetical protein PR002_g6283 [Phytophthora rubi]KAE9042701.1 hypothetical protein PR001_g6083 [Phytophthora rubi]KAE9345013.1 hypothetical protein PR003_g8163 [Phytophthora rubi]
MGISQNVDPLHLPFLKRWTLHQTSVTCMDLVPRWAVAVYCDAPGSALAMPLGRLVLAVQHCMKDAVYFLLNDDALLAEHLLLNDDALRVDQEDALLVEH